MFDTLFITLHKDTPSGDRFYVREAVDRETLDHKLAWIVRGMLEELEFQIKAAKENNETKKV